MAREDEAPGAGRSDDRRADDRDGDRADDRHGGRASGPPGPGARSVRRIELRTLRVLALEMGVDEPDEHVRRRALAVAGVADGALRGFRIAKKALDARRKGGVHRLRFVVHADLVLERGYHSARLSRALRSGAVVEAPRAAGLVLDELRCRDGERAAVVVGAGPAGLFAAWTLAENGVSVTVLDRGAALEERGRDVVRFHRTRVVDPESNLLFGEGGAGTYSDGKLYTRVDDPLEVPILERLVQCGAPDAIRYDARAHIGTDRLHRILPRVRRRMEALGVRFAWRTRLEGLVLEDAAAGGERRVRAVHTSAGELRCDALVLAPGHSARDTFAALAAQGVLFEARPFQLGLRIEHPQELVDRGWHGTSEAALGLGPASYNLVCKPGDGLAGAHSFCMCPGGRIVASVSDPGLLCTNGMSNSTHSSPWANAALVTTFGPRELGQGPFAGVELQRALEQRFFEEGGGDYTAPAQSAQDFLAGREGAATRHSSFVFGTRPARLDRLLPAPAVEALRRALERFDRALPGFAGPEGLFVGLESRSSSPVRMPRDTETRLAAGFANLYPVGEGAGWAGGIMSAAIDGARSALALAAGVGTESS